ncbi:MAG: hypothetical protein Q8Q09_14635 [Deltaproteobacteria bacterium]|nr:hypothetical protein [Deltaproteobacteria bacterium]
MTSPSAPPLTHSLGPALSVALLVRTVLFGVLGTAPLWDGTIYAAIAQTLASGQGYLHWDGSGRASAFFPVGFPSAIAVFLRAGLSSTRASFAVNLGATALTMLSLASLLRTSPHQSRALWLYALAPGPALWCLATMSETLNGALLIASVALAMSPTRGPKSSILSGILLGLAALVRPQSLLLAPLVGALSAPALSTRPRRLARATVITTMALLTVLPWSLRNTRALNGFALVSTNGGANLLLGSLPDAHGGWRELTPRDGCTEVSGEVHRDRCYTRRAVTQITQNPLVWVAQIPRKFARTMTLEWAPLSYLGQGSLRRAPRPLLWALAALCTGYFWALCLAALRALRTREERPHQEASLATLAIASLLVTGLTHGVFIGDDRFHLPCVPLLCAAAAMGLSRTASSSQPMYTPSEPSR